MKFIISNQEIIEAISKMGKLLTAKSTLPILAGVLVEAKGNCIRFTASSGPESIVHRVVLNEETGSNVITEGRSVLSKETFDTAKKLKGNIQFEATDTVLTLTQDKTKLEFPVMDADEYPKIEPESGEKIVLSGHVFAEMVNKTAFAASLVETRPILQAVNMTFSETTNVFVATDSHRLSRYTTPGSMEGEEHSLSVPASILEQAVKSFDSSLDVTIFSSKHSIAINNGNTFLFSLLLEGNYPDTSRLIPTEFTRNIQFNRKEVMEALELLQTISDGKINLKMEGIFVHLSSTKDGKKGCKELAYESYDGDDDFTISFASNFVIEILKRIDSPSVRFSFNDSMKPFIIVPTTDEVTNIQLVLPVRTY